MDAAIDDPMEETGSPPGDLRRVVQANEGFKRVIRISSRVNLVALNAMLIAKRSGEKSRGFVVVSSELRVFSRKLEGAMNCLAALIFDLIEDAAVLQKLGNEQRHLQSIHTREQVMQERVAPALIRMDERILEADEAIARDWRQLQFELYRVLQLCETGGSLSRSAKIEAVYGGDMSTTLKQVANQIDETTNEIFSTLKLLRTQLAEP